MDARWVYPPGDGTSSMVKLLIVRHGHVEGIAPERFRGRRDITLSERGLEEARAVARYIASRYEPTRIFTSPLRRCVQTGQEIGRACNVSASVQPELTDLDYGDWEWQTHAEVARDWPKLFALWQTAPHRVRFPHGESLQDLAARVSNALRSILEHHSGETVVAVGHDSTNRVMLLELLDLALSGYRRLAQDPCGLSEVDMDMQRILVRRVNETQHLTLSPSV
jgi:broad specificity phosphatase PhoE